ncbi:MAG: LamG domain-containing protein, partial [Verrucomicrobiota bacterium]
SRRLIAFLAVLGCPLSGAVVSLWEFENNTNSSNSSYNATAVGSPGYAAGYIGRAFSLNGSGQYATVPDIGSLANATVSVWIRTSDANSPTSQAIFHSSSFGAGNPHFLLEYGGAVPANTMTGLVAATTSAEVKRNGANSPISENTWYHVTFTWVGANSGLKLYLNGVELGSATGAAANLNLTNMRIGAYGSSRYFNGLLDDLAVWNETLTAGQVKGIHSLAASTLNYGQADVGLLYGLTAGQSTTTRDGAVWSHATGLTGAVGQLQTLGGGAYALNLGGGVGVQGQFAVPEPPVQTALYLAALAGVLLLAGGSGLTPAPQRSKVAVRMNCRGPMMR